MQFLTLSRRRTKLCSDVDFQRRLEAEAGMFRDLRQAGIIRQIWHRGDAPGECLLIEARNEESARAILETSPLVRSGLFEIDAIVPLKPHDAMAG
jgi:muconolactone delta-isomerase